MAIVVLKSNIRSEVAIVVLKEQYSYCRGNSRIEGTISVLKNCRTEEALIGPERTEEALVGPKRTEKALVRLRPGRSSAGRSVAT